MDKLYAINAAKTEFRDCFNLGDSSRLLALRILSSLASPMANRVSSAAVDWKLCGLDCSICSSVLQ